MATLNFTNCLNLLPEGVTNCSLLSPADTRISCLISGQSDVYGLGIRVGLYLQWFSTVLTFVFRPESYSELMVANCIMSLGVAIAYIVIRADFFVHEVFVVLILLAATVCMATLELLEHLVFRGHVKVSPPTPTPMGLKSKVRKYVRHIGDPSWIIATTFLVGVLGWQLWSGPAMATRCPCCAPQFIKSNFTRPEFMRLYFGIYVILALAVFAGCAFLVKLILTDMELPPHPRGTRTKRVCTALVLLALVSLAIAVVEVVVYQNRIKNVQQVSDAGQIIPLVVGISTFLYLCYRVRHK